MGISYKIPLVYVAGPYTSKGGSTWEVDMNIHKARMKGAEIVCLGGYPVIPQANTAHFDGIVPEVVDEAAFFYDATMQLMLRCDALTTCGEWEMSKGAVKEVRMAEQERMPILFSIRQLKEWIDRWIDEHQVVEMRT